MIKKYINILRFIACLFHPSGSHNLVIYLVPVSIVISYLCIEVATVQTAEMIDSAKQFIPDYRLIYNLLQCQIFIILDHSVYFLVADVPLLEARQMQNQVVGKSVKVTLLLEICFPFALLTRQIWDRLSFQLLVNELLQTGLRVRGVVRKAGVARWRCGERQWEALIALELVLVVDLRALELSDQFAWKIVDDRTAFYFFHFVHENFVIFRYAYFFIVIQIGHELLLQLRVFSIEQLQKIY